MTQELQYQTIVLLDFLIKSLNDMKAKGKEIHKLSLCETDNK